MKYNAFISYAHAADSRLTPVLQSALHKLGKPWYKRRALNVFRDKTNLPVTPELWPTIVKALEQSEYFILMASPESAASKWVLPEVEYWLKHRSLDTLLIVHTGGTLFWNDEKDDFDPEKTDALSPALYGKFPHEPFIVDLTTIKTAKDRNLSNPRFKDPLIRLAATLHKLPQNDFIGEEIKQHRRTLRIRNTAIATLLLLLISTGAFLWRSVQNEKKAQKNQAQTLTTLADIRVEEDPTLSFRLAEAAYKKDPGNTEAHIRLMDAANYHLYDVIPGKVLGMSDDHSKMVYIDDKTSELCVLGYSTKDTIRFTGDFSPDHKSFFSRDLTKFGLVNPDKIDIVKVFDLENNTEITLEGDTQGDHIGFSISGNKFFINNFSAEFSLRAWDLHTGKRIPLKDNTEGYSKITFTSDDRYLMGAGLSSEIIKIWDLTTGDNFYVSTDSILPESEYGTDHLFFTTSIDGCRFAVLRSADDEYILSVYEIGQSIQCLLQIPISPIPQMVFRGLEHIEFTKDGNKLIILNVWGQIRAFDLIRRREIIMEDSGYFYDQKQITSNGDKAVAFSTDTGEIFSLWDLESGRKIKLEGSLNGYNFLDFSPTGKILIGINYDGIQPAQIWDTTSGNLLFVGASSYPFIRVIFSSNDEKVALFSQDNNIIKVIDLNTKEEWELLGNIPNPDKMVFTPDSNKIIVIDDLTGLSKIWNISTKIKFDTFERQDRYDNVIFSKDGQTLVFFNKEGTKIAPWDLKRDEKIDLSGSVKGFKRLSLSFDTKKILTYDDSDDRIPIQIWELTSGKAIKSFEANGLSDKALEHNDGYKRTVLKNISYTDNWTEYTPDSIKLIAIQKSTKFLGKFELGPYKTELTVMVHDLETGKAIEFDKIIRGVATECFISNNHLLVEYENAITNVFDLETGNIHELKSFRGKQFLDIHYNPDGKRLTTITKDGLTRIMYTHPDSIIKEVNSRKGGVWKLDAQTRAKYGLSSRD